jgi:beta-lactam-binding protein with PASTA domain
MPRTRSHRLGPGALHLLVALTLALPLLVMVVGAAAADAVSPTKPVAVPALVGRTVGAAAHVLSRRGLELGRVLGGGDVVKSQSPSAGALVPRLSVVDVFAPISPPPLVMVPDLTGDTRSRAAATLSAMRLVLARGPDSDATIASQRPRPGTPVLVGSTVAVSFQAPTAWDTVAVGSGLALALVVGAAAGYRRRLTRRRDGSSPDDLKVLEDITS